MAKRTGYYISYRNASARGFRAGVLGALRGGAYSSAPVRITKFVGSAATDSAARYSDVDHVKADVRRSERVALKR